MNRRQFVCGATLAALSSAPCWAAGEFRALSGDSFFDGEGEVRLIDIIAPGSREPYGAEATRALAELIASSPVLIVDNVLPNDRWGRRVGKTSIPVRVEVGPERELVAADHASPENLRNALAVKSTEFSPFFQEMLVAAGAARVRPESDDSEWIAKLLALEAEARAAKKGLWAEWRYRVFDAKAAEPATGAFSIVEGVIATVVKRSGRVYLNFGEDYRTDFTATTKSGAAKKWAKQGADLLTFAGAHVRVRGYVAWINGPSIELTHVQQIEVLEMPVVHDMKSTQAAPSN